MNVVIPRWRRPWPSNFSTRIAVAWARVYTTGMSVDARERRLAEIESDCWEHMYAASGRGPGRGLGLLGRVIRGSPSDVAWRLQWKGVPEMRTNARIEQIAGVGMIGVLVLLVAGVVVQPGVDTREPYFRESWTEASGNTGAMIASNLLLFGAAAFFLAAGLGLGASLWRVGRIYSVAIVGLLGIGAAVLTGGATLGMASIALADAWRDSGYSANELLGPSRTIVGASQAMYFGSTVGPIGSCLVLGWLVLRKDIAPRWTGVPAVLAVLAMTAGLLIAAFSTAWFYLWGLALLMALVFILAFAVMLIVRGIRPTSEIEQLPVPGA